MYTNQVLFTKCNPDACYFLHDFNGKIRITKKHEKYYHIFLLCLF